ncbi:hypothetical protein J22TS1_33200 [Siminovitchia terrae]|nr:hypothetical protein J22TS1_33200 [Siminovitchia terrae]
MKSSVQKDLFSFFVSGDIPSGILEGFNLIDWMNGTHSVIKRVRIFHELVGSE